MKKILSSNKFITLGVLFIFALLLSPKQTYATFHYVVGDIPYVVSASNIPPVADAGADQNIPLPTSTTSLVGIGSYDPDGTIVSYLWTKTAGSGTITSANNSIASVSGLTAGTSTFCLTVTDNNLPTGATDTDCMDVHVSAAGNIPPTAYAGADQNIVVPVNSTSVSGAGFDADGIITSYVWTQVSGPTPTVIVASSNLATITGMSAVGVYTFNLRVYDNGGAFGDDQMTVTVSTTPPVTVTASLWANPNTLPFGGGNSTLTWHSTNTTTCSSIDFPTGGAVSNSPVYGTGNGVVVSLISTMTYHITCTGASGSANASATITVAPKNTTINGACSVPAQHWTCAVGSSSNNTGGLTGPWTWDCQGLSGGLTASCFEAAGGGSDTQCSDGVDNDDPEDTLIDAQDPGCWTMKDVPSSYDPNDDNERNTPKIKEIEI